MTVKFKSSLMAGFSGLALVTLAACGGAQNDVDPANADPVEFETASVPAPTITPNAEPLESQHPNSIQPETTLSISAQGTVNHAPDIAMINAGVQQTAKTAKEAMDANAVAMNGVMDALKAANIADRDMQTSNLSLNPQYDYSNRENGGPRLTGYQASNQLTVKVRDLDNLGSLLDAMVTAGGNTLNGIQFGLDDDRAVKNQARDRAMKEAIARAELYAAASGYEVARVVTISESGGYAPQPLAMMAEARSMDRSTPVAAGEVGYSITVNVVFELRKPSQQ